jgi:F-box-like
VPLIPLCSGRALLGSRTLVYSMRTVPSHTNTHDRGRSIACQLPIELLQTIFLLLAELYVSDTGKGHRPSPRPDWIAVTHVCRQWRSAALGLHQLWSSITPGLSILWAQAMIERSSPLPVRVDLRISTSSTDGLHPLAASELLFAASRIRTLRLVGLRTDILRVLERLRSPSPLEALNLSIYDSGPPVVLPETLFGTKAPRLRSLTFAADACIRAPRWLLAGIAEFTTGADTALAELLDALRAMPQLQVLRVQHCRAVWEEDDPAPAVALPCLQLISFRDTTPRRFVLLAQRIDAPSTVRRHLFWRSWAVASWTRWAVMLRAMRAFVPRDSAPGADDGDLRVVRVAGGAARGSFSAWTRSATASYEERENALFSFEIDWSGSPVDPQGGDETMLEHSSPFFHLAGLCAQLLAGRVVDLTIEPELELESESESETGPGMGMGTDVERVPAGGDAAAVVQHWESLVGALRSVQVLRLHPGSLPILNALTTNARLLPDLQKIYVVQRDVRRAVAPVVPPDSRVVLWNLKRLVALRAGSLPVNHHGPVVTTTRNPSASIGKELVGLVRERAGVEVVLVGCGMDRRALDELRKHTQVSVGPGDEWVYV